MNCLRISWLVVVIGIVYLSLKPAHQQNLVEVNDKVGHFIAYFVLFILSQLTFPNWRWKKTALFSFLLSCVLEALQSFVPGREVSVYDVLANAGGVLIGVLFYFLFHKQILKLLQFFRIKA